MARITITADCPARLEGFVAGIEWANDSAVAVESVHPDGRIAVLFDQDADDERYLLLGSFGLMHAEQQSD
jgi:hypothetical protein